MLLSKASYASKKHIYRYAFLGNRSHDLALQVDTMLHLSLVKQHDEAKYVIVLEYIDKLFKNQFQTDYRKVFCVTPSGRQTRLQGLS